MRYSLNKRIFLMISIVLFIIFSFLYIMNSFFLVEYYKSHKKNQILKISKDLKLNKYENLWEIGERNNLRIEILDEMRMRENLDRFSRGPFSRDENTIKMSDISSNGTLFTFQGRGPENKEIMVLFVEKIGEDKYLAVYSPIYSIGESIKISKDFTLIASIISLGLSIFLSILISRKITKPIKSISLVAEKISNLDFNEKLVVERNDELGDLCSSINKMSDSLKFIIEDLKITNERLKLEIEKEKEIDKMRREFISNVNHELKTPLALIKGYTEGLKDNVAKEEDRDYYLNVIEDECNNMDNLVKKLLLLSKYEGDFKIEKEEIDIKKILDSLIKRYMLEVNDKKINVIINISSDYELLGDYIEIKTAIDNLYRNAISYVEENGEIIIECQKEFDKMSFSIKNNFFEVSQEEIEKWWEPFNKYDKARTRKFSGTGLGLPIVAAIMKKHNFSYGSLWENGYIKFYFKM